MMKTTLQYAYSITVFIGVLFTAYFMINKEGNSRLPLQALQSPAYRVEGNVDPAVNQLFQVEDAILEMRKSQITDEALRLPTQTK